jgi:glycosyltransferase involved in cell wall biosynthesis
MTSELVLVANTRLPSQRAQALQVVQAAASFARAGAQTTLVYARRARTLPLPAGVDLFEHYSVPPGPRPGLVEVPCLDAIDAVPRALQPLPARIQEISFSNNAAARIRWWFPDSTVLSREILCAARLVARAHRRVFLELHRVPRGFLGRQLPELARRARGIVAISGGVRDDLVALGVDPASVLVEHDAFEPARFAEMPSREQARAKLKLDPAAKVVAYTGGLLEWKGADVLVDAAREMPETTFVIAGGMDRDVQKLRERARGLANVRIDGFQPPELVADYLAAADVGVAPNRSRPEISSRYTSPLKVFEAMAAGLPLVASDLPSLRELLRHDVDAWLVAPDDPKALAAGLRRVLADPELRLRLSRTFRERAPAHTWDARAARILAWIGSRS